MLVVADDLTGAADTAGVFAACGHRSTVTLGMQPAKAPVLSIDTHSRAMAEADAFMTVAAAVSAHPDRRLFVKIDSTMRGHVRATVDAALSAMADKPERVVVCPAFPAMGRTVVEGSLLVDGADFGVVNLREVFTGFGVGSGLFIPTVRTDEDLGNVVKTMENARVLWVGSAGLARHVALATAVDGTTAGDSTRSTAVGPAASNVAVIVGSQNERTLEQLRRLDRGVVVHRVDPREATSVESVRNEIVGCDGLVLTGGHTARATLEMLGVDRIDIMGEVEPGVPWGYTTVAGNRVAIVTKAGGFGSMLTLQRSVDFLAGRAAAY